MRVRDRIEWTNSCVTVKLPLWDGDGLTEAQMREIVKDAILRGDGDPVIIEEGDGYVEYEYDPEV